MLGFDTFLQVIYLLVGMFCAGFFAYRAVKLLFPDQEVLAAQARLGVESATREYRHWILKILSPFYQAMVPRIQQMKLPRYRQKKKASFVASGLDDQFDPDEFIGLKICSSLLGIVFLVLFFVQAGMNISFLWVIVAATVGFLIPDYAVWEVKRKRQKDLLRELPTVMDLLTLSVEAGMDFMAAIGRVLSYSKEGPMKEELARVLNEIQLGTTRSDALNNMAARVQLTDVSSFASILIQADQMGSSIGPVLRAQSDILRRNRFQRAEREGAKATQKILIPLVCCILPAFIIVILGPVICDLVYNQDLMGGLFGS